MRIAPALFGTALLVASGCGDDAGPAMNDGGALPGADASAMDSGAPRPDTGPPATDAGAPAMDAGPSSTRHTPRPLGSTAADNGFYEYLPPGYGPGALAPLLVFWHGIGENGNGTSDLDRILSNGPPRLIARNQWPNDRPFVVLSVQHSGLGCPSASEIHSFISFAMDGYEVDPARIYLTGLSCGAIGSWDYLGRYRGEQVVAAVLVAGNGRGAWSTAGCGLGEVAIWAFHGDADFVVAPEGSTEPMANLIACPSPPRRDARLTVYPRTGHDSWSDTYDLSAGHDIYAWLLGITR